MPIIFLHKRLFDAASLEVSFHLNLRYLFSRILRLCASKTVIMTTEPRKFSSEIQLDTASNEEKFSKFPSYCPPNMIPSFHEKKFRFSYCAK